MILDTLSPDLKKSLTKIQRKSNNLNSFMNEITSLNLDKEQDDIDKDKY